MPVEYLHRLRLVRELSGAPIRVDLPSGYIWQPWHPTHANILAEILHRSFSGETDADLFPSLGSTTGCRMLVHAVQDSPGFCPEATGVLVGPGGPVGAILVLIEAGCGTIPGIGILPAYRGQGLGSAILRQSLQAFAALGFDRIELEVTATNAPARALYRRLGFREYKSTYRTREVPDRSMIGLGI